MSASITMYHPSSCGVGSALRFELHPYKVEDPDSGRIEVGIAPQDGDRFAWEDVLCVSLGFEDVSRMLMVFRGEIESINDGKGITRRDCTFNMRHVIEPVCGYEMMLTNGDRVATFTLKSAEALGISLALEQSMSKLVFEMEG